MDFDRIAFYKFLASSLHPAGAFSSVKTAFLEIFSMPPFIFEGFLLASCAYKPWMSKLHHAVAFSPAEITFLDLSSMDCIEKTKFFSREVVAQSTGVASFCADTQGTTAEARMRKEPWVKWAGIDKAKLLWKVELHESLGSTVLQ